MAGRIEYNPGGGSPSQSSQPGSASSLLLNPNHRGRQKIVYTPAELERTPLITIVCGMQGVGKTHQSIIDIDNYTKDNPNTGKPGRKVLIVDFSLDESYQKYKAVLPEYIRNLTEPRARRIIPFTSTGQKFDLDKMRKVSEYVVTNYMNGLLVMDDIDKYLTGKKGQSLIGTMTTVRHAGIDLLITHQSVAKVSKTEWENAAFVRLHHQLDDIAMVKEGISNYPLMKIAQIIVDKRYFEAERDYSELGKITEDEYRNRRSYFVYIDMRKHKIIGATLEDFQNAVMQFIRMYPKLINTRMKVGDEFGNSLNKQQAMQSLYKDYAHYFKAA